MELWVSVTLFAVFAAGFLLAAKFLKNRPPLRRYIMLACVIFGAMMLLYSLLTGCLLAFAEPDPDMPETPALSSQESPVSPDTLYLSLDGIDRENGIFYLSFTGLDEYLSPTESCRLPMSENLVSSMLPGWDETGKRYDFYTAKDFASYWNHCEEQGFSAIGSLCRFQLNSGTVTDLNEIDPARFVLTE